MGVRAWVALGVLTGVLGAGCTKPFEEALDRGNALASEGRFIEAETAFAEAVALSPDSTRAHLLHGNVLMSLKKTTDAEAAWRLAAPSSDSAREALAWAALSGRDAGVALEWLGSMQSPRSSVLRGRALLALGRPDQALAACDAVPGPEGQYVKGSALIALKRYPEARAVFDQMNKATYDPVALRDARTALGLYGLARLEAAEGHADQALGHLKQAQVVSGPSWNAEAVAADPAFAFLFDSPMFKQLLKPPP